MHSFAHSAANWIFIILLFQTLRWKFRLGVSECVRARASFVKCWRPKTNCYYYLFFIWPNFFSKLVACTGPVCSLVCNPKWMVWLFQYSLNSETSFRITVSANRPIFASDSYTQKHTHMKYRNSCSRANIRKQASRTWIIIKSNRINSFCVSV